MTFEQVPKQLENLISQVAMLTILVKRLEPEKVEPSNQMMKISEVAKLWNCDRKTAEKWLLRKGLIPHELEQSKRWKKAEVLTAINDSTVMEVVKKSA